ncbi:MAG: GIY-YIG nuclease family protein [Candidatus Hodarchaeales archaeon]|jgi:hypothetical protein
MSKETLRSRICYHFQGNAEGDTLRLTLGCLLVSKLGIELRRVSSGKRMIFTKKGEEILSNWMGNNAFISWVEHNAPWEIESQLLHSLSLPLNLQDNRSHPFAPTLTAIRLKCRHMAEALPIVKE